MGASRDRAARSRAEFSTCRFLILRAPTGGGEGGFKEQQSRGTWDPACRKQTSFGARVEARKCLRRCRASASVLQRDHRESTDLTFRSSQCCQNLQSRAGGAASSRRGPPYPPSSASTNDLEDKGAGSDNLRTSASSTAIIHTRRVRQTGVDSL
jgi:hypothetical protein